MSTATRADGRRTTPLGRHAFAAIGCRHTVLTTDPSVAAAAGAVVEGLVAELDVAASRFRADSEVRRIAVQVPLPGADVVTATVSPLLARCLEAALHAARITDGLVDPTLGWALVAAGYDDDLDVVRTRTADVAPLAAATPARPAVEPVPDGWRVTTTPTRRAADLPRITLVPVRPPVSWRDVELDVGRDGTTVTVPTGTLLDLGATAKAVAADLAAERLASLLPGGFLVNLGGDLACAGPAPAGGWEVGVEGEDGAIRQVVVTTDQGLATSSTRLRRWGPEGARHHHLLDPRTHREAPTTWAQVTCAGATCLEANAASTAAVVLGEAAPEWLAAHGIPARLERLDGRVATTPGWPDAQAPAA